jgi:uncharacterized FlaG/YvyC family protein
VTTGYFIKTTRKIGFWLMLFSSIALSVISVLQFIKSKNSNNFATENTFEDTSAQVLNEENVANSTNIDKEKITNFAKNISDTMNEQGKNIATKLSDQAKSVTTNISNSSNNTKIKKENPNEIMEQLKKLNELKEAGILTDEEFTAKKQEMLERL